MNSLSTDDLNQYRRLIEDKETSASQIFSGLKKIFKGYFSNVQNLIMMEPALKFLPLAEATDHEMDAWRSQFEENNSLRAAYEIENDQLNVIDTDGFSLPELEVHIENLKRSNDRLKEIQARLKANAELGTVVHARVVENGKALEEIMIDASREIGPEQDKYLWLFTRKFLWVTFQARLLTTVAAFAIAVILDYFSQSGEAEALANPDFPAILQNHYVFLLTFFLIELLIVDSLKGKLARYLAIKFSVKSFDYISGLLPDNLKKIGEATDKHGISPITVMDKLVALVSKDKIKKTAI